MSPDLTDFDPIAKSTSGSSFKSVRQRSPNLFTKSVFISSMFLSALLGVFSSAEADEMIRPTRYEVFLDSVLQTHFFVPGSQVAWADYAALKRDFPALRQLNSAQIDAWILANYAYVSEQQTRLRGLRVNDFQFDANRGAQFTHPMGYNRASVALEHAGVNPNEPNGRALVDLKGSGHGNARAVQRQLNAWQSIQGTEDYQAQLDQLRIHDHSDGMMTLGEAIAETSRQLAVQATFDLHNARAQTSFQTVESYFIIRLPISILKDRGQAEPAAIYARQAHVRGSGQLEVPPHTYSDDFGGRQASATRSAVDFGGVVITHPDLQRTFGDPAALVVRQRADAQLSNAWKYGHEAAAAFVAQVGRDPVGARQVLTSHFEIMLSPLAAQLASLPRVSRETELGNYLKHRLNAGLDPVGSNQVSQFLQTEVTIPELLRLLPIVFTPSAMRANFGFSEMIFSRLIGSPGFGSGTEARQRLLELASNVQFRSGGVAFDRYVAANFQSRDDASLRRIIELTKAPGNDDVKLARKFRELPIATRIGQLENIFSHPHWSAEFVIEFLFGMLENRSFESSHPEVYREIVQRLATRSSSDGPYAIQMILNRFTDNEVALGARFAEKLLAVQNSQTTSGVNGLIQSARYRSSQCQSIFSGRR